MVPPLNRRTTTTPRFQSVGDALIVLNLPGCWAMVSSRQKKRKEKIKVCGTGGDITYNSVHDAPLSGSTPIPQRRKETQPQRPGRRNYQGSASAFTGGMHQHRPSGWPVQGAAQGGASHETRPSALRRATISPGKAGTPSRPQHGCPGTAVELNENAGGGRSETSWEADGNCGGPSGIHGRQNRPSREAVRVDSPPHPSCMDLHPEPSLLPPLSLATPSPGPSRVFSYLRPEPGSKWSRLRIPGKEPALGGNVAKAKEPALWADAADGLRPLPLCGANWKMAPGSSGSCR